ncbi:MAG: tRNA (adenosine(37)-N6)-threonylcarbamoyltransferase complex dimerization subunit type 1 TsaB [Clostridia bacterium]|nr:tRNA (adenosine(37)-N6)-threonylcarbamoyltransferase complex dimerization subunit type 1 TsaB [Clostridia bacterium]
MRVLAVDTSGPAVGVALLEGDRLLFECSLTHERTHSVWLMPAVEQALRQTERRLGDIDLFAAVAGPGSFTGVRIGVATVKSLAQVTGKPCIGIHALEALAAGAGEFSGAVCPLLDARAGQVYAAAFGPGLPPRRLLPDAALPLAEFLERAAELDAPLLFTGDGAPIFAGAIAERFGDAARIAPPHLCGLRAGAAAVLAREAAGSAVAYGALRPLYLRAPQAERERAARRGERP